MNHAVLIDFGSTFTKMVAVDINEGRLVTTGKFPSTVHSDAAIALNQCFATAKEALGREAFSKALKLATSSAAGGLRMAVVGLTKSISYKAGRNASFSAGAKVVHSVAGIISSADLAEIAAANAEILLFCGGHEGGNTQSLLENARLLSESRLNIPIIYAGNSAVSQEIRRLMVRGGKECFLAANIIPTVGALDIEPTAAIVRDLFMKRITNMKGVGSVQSELAELIIPTPAAVLAAGELLARGTEVQPGIGDLMMVDVGGATTDIYSYTENQSYNGAKRIGAPETYTKRTVEGDMGMRESSICLLAEVGEGVFAERCRLSIEEARRAIDKRVGFTDFVARDEKEKTIDHTIAEEAVRISARRHAGTVTREFQKGCRLVQRGKNLTDIKTVVGTGGIIVNEGDPHSILNMVAVMEQEKGSVLLPERVETFVDQDYVLFAAGLLRNYDEEIALTIMKRSLGLI